MAKRREKPETKTKRKGVSKEQFPLGAFVKCFRLAKFLKYKRRIKINKGLINKAKRTNAPECVKANKEDPLPVKEEKPQPPEKKKRLPKVNYNDLVIQELAMGQPDGTKATRHSKVSISFICKTFEGVRIAEGKHQFQLGSGEVIQGLNRGVKGMRVGDTRRLMMPSSCRVGGKEPWEVPGGSSSSTIVCQVTLNNVEN